MNSLQIESELRELRRENYEVKKRLRLIEGGRIPSDFLVVGTGRGGRVGVKFFSGKSEGQSTHEIFVDGIDGLLKTKLDGIDVTTVGFSAPIYVFHFSDQDGYTENLTTAWVPIDLVTLFTIQGEFAPFPTAAQHRLCAVVQDDITDATDVEIRLQDVTNTLTIATINTITVRDFYSITDFINLPTADAEVELQWRRTANSGTATIFSASWVMTA